jgi:hypothetical protein
MAFHQKVAGAIRDQDSDRAVLAMEALLAGAAHDLDTVLGVGVGDADAGGDGSKRVVAWT